MTVENLSERTIASYSRGVRDVCQYYSCEPEKIKPEQLLSYLFYLKDTLKRADSTLRIAASGIKYAWTHFLNCPDVIKFIPQPKRERKLPYVLNGKQVKLLIDNTKNLKHRVIFKLLYYGCGLRRNELRMLQVTSVNSKRMSLRVEKGKGNKERDVILPQSILPELRAYYRMFRPESYLFYGRDKHIPISESVLRWALKQAVIRCKLPRKVCLHTLRHCFATHLLATGHNVLMVQKLLGHQDIRTTMKYLHLEQLSGKPPHSPLDILYHV